MPICGCNCWECEDLTKTLSGKSWTEFTPEQIRWIADGTSLFSVEAFNYMLPAYMRAALIDPDEASQAIAYTAWKFFPDDGKAPFRSPEGLNLEQRGVLYDWLDWYIVSYNEAGLAATLAIPPEDEKHRRFLEQCATEERARIERDRAELTRLEANFPRS